MYALQLTKIAISICLCDHSSTLGYRNYCKIMIMHVPPQSLSPGPAQQPAYFFNFPYFCSKTDCAYWNQSVFTLIIDLVLISLFSPSSFYLIIFQNEITPVLDPRTGRQLRYQRSRFIHPCLQVNTCMQASIYAET